MRSAPGSRRRRMPGSGSTSSGRSPAIAASRSNCCATAARRSGYGLTESRRFTIAPPGRLPLGSQPLLAGRCAGPAGAARAVARLARRSGWAPARCRKSCIARSTCCALAVRLRLLPSLLPFARLMHRAINRAALGRASRRDVRRDRGRGATASSVDAFLAHDRRRRRRPVHSRDGVRGDHPQLPRRQAPGAGRARRDRRPRAGRLRDSCSRGARSTPARAKRLPAALPLYRRLLGEAYDALPAPLQAMHDLNDRDESPREPPR